MATQDELLQRALSSLQRSRGSRKTATQTLARDLGPVGAGIGLLADFYAGLKQKDAIRRQDVLGAYDNLFKQPAYQPTLSAFRVSPFVSRDSGVDSARKMMIGSASGRAIPAASDMYSDVYNTYRVDTYPDVVFRSRGREGFDQKRERILTPSERRRRAIEDEVRRERSSDRSKTPPTEKSFVENSSFESSNVYGFWYDEGAGELYIRFRDNGFVEKMVKGNNMCKDNEEYTYAHLAKKEGRIFAYTVPRTIYEGIMGASSKGKFVWQYLRECGTIYGKQFPVREVDSSDVEKMLSNKSMPVDGSQRISNIRTKI